MKDNRLAVVIPVYKSEMTPNEKISLKQCICLVKSHDIIFVSFSDEILNYYRHEVKLISNRTNLKGFIFDARYFESIQGYNNLMLSSKFYFKFIKYKFMLIYQLDCFLFSNDFSFWIDNNYDYVGAPWMDINKSRKLYESLLSSENKIIKWVKSFFDYNKGEHLLVGNGGFSLRRVRKFYLISKIIKILEPSIISNQINEDLVWSIVVPKYIPNFRIPAPEVASLFSIETNPNYFFSKNNEILPIGCHAWDKYDYNFWEPHIQAFNCNFQ